MHLPHVVTTFGWHKGNGTRLRGRYTTFRQASRQFFTSRYNQCITIGALDAIYKKAHTGLIAALQTQTPEAQWFVGAGTDNRLPLVRP